MARKTSAPIAPLNTEQQCWGPITVGVGFSLALFRRFFHHVLSLPQSIRTPTGRHQPATHREMPLIIYVLEDLLTFTQDANTCPFDQLHWEKLHHRDQ